MEEQLYSAQVDKVLQQSSGSSGPDPTTMFVEGVKFAAESAKQGITGADLLAAIKTGVEVGRPAQGDASPLRDQLYVFQQEALKAAHDREIALIQSKAESEKAAYAASNPGSALQQTVGFVKELQGSGILPRPSDPATSYKEKELDARLRLAEMQRSEEERARVREESRHERKELQENATLDRLLQTANKAIETIADPISRAVGDSMRIRANLPPGAPAPQVQPGQQPMTRDQQLVRLDQIIAQASEAKARLAAAPPSPEGPQPGQGSAPGEGPRRKTEGVGV